MSKKRIGMQSTTLCAKKRFSFQDPLTYFSHLHIHKQSWPNSTNKLHKAFLLKWQYHSLLQSIQWDGSQFPSLTIIPKKNLVILYLYGCTSTPWKTENVPTKETAARKKIPLKYNIRPYGWQVEYYILCRDICTFIILEFRLYLLHFTWLLVHLIIT